MSILTLLLGVLIICVIVWAAQQLTRAFNVPEPIRTVIIVAVVLILVIWFLSGLGWTGGMGLR